MTALSIGCQYCLEDFADSAAYAAHHGGYAGGSGITYCLDPKICGLVPWVTGNRVAWRIPPGGASIARQRPPGRDHESDGQHHD